MERNRRPRKIRESVQGNRFFIALSFFLTLMLFIYVKMDSVRTVPLDYVVRVDAPEDVRVLLKDSVVRVYVRDRVRNILPLLFSHRVLRVEVRPRSVGDVKVDLEQQARKSLNIPYVYIEPESLYMFVDRYVTVSREISPSIKGNPPKGYSVEGVRVNPRFADVRAPESILSGIMYIQTEDVDISSVKGVDTFRVALVRPGDVVEVSPDSVTVIVRTRKVKDEDVGNPAGSGEGK